MIVELDEDKKQAHLVIRAGMILREIAEARLNEESGDTECGGVIWHPEFARYMLESTPLNPYGHEISDLLCVECNMNTRYLDKRRTIILINFIDAAKLKKSWPPIKSLCLSLAFLGLDWSILFQKTANIIMI